MELLDLIENEIAINTEMYSSIIGEAPSKGARSPILWNQAFKQFEIDNEMHPFDVNLEKLIPLLDYLNADKSFTGGAITMPYKENIFKWLGNNVSAEAKSIGAVNCLYRSEDGNLFGTNTDGEASLFSAKKIIGDIKGKKILQLGCGGAGRAVAAFFSFDGCDLRIAVRDAKKISKYASDIGASCLIWDDIPNAIKESDVLINTTSVGFRDEKSSPIKNDYFLSSKLSLVFDIIYEPLKTNLLAMAEMNQIKTLNGLDMNLQQAVLAFNYANTIEDESLTAQYMKTVD